MTASRYDWFLDPCRGMHRVCSTNCLVCREWTLYWTSNFRKKLGTDLVVSKNFASFLKMGEIDLLCLDREMIWVHNNSLLSCGRCTWPGGGWRSHWTWVDRLARWSLQVGAVVPFPYFEVEKFLLGHAFAHRFQHVKVVERFIAMEHVCEEDEATTVVETVAAERIIQSLWMGLVDVTETILLVDDVVHSRAHVFARVERLVEAVIIYRCSKLVFEVDKW